MSVSSTGQSPRRLSLWSPASVRLSLSEASSATEAIKDMDSISQILVHSHLHGLMDKNYPCTMLDHRLNLCSFDFVFWLLSSAKMRLSLSHQFQVRSVFKFC